MTVKSRFWAEWTTQEFARSRDDGSLSQTIAVIPLGATEQHGPHLPMRVDTALVDGVLAVAIAQLGQQVPALFLPTQAVGYSPEHAAFPGTLTLKAETTIRLWTDIAESAAASGIRKLVLFNAHGGHTGMMDVVARDLRARLGMLVYCVSWFSLPLITADGEDAGARFSSEEHRFGVHAGDMETSMMLALAPQQVRMQFARNFRSASQDRAEDFPILGNGKSAKLAWQMQDYNPAGAAGNAAAATAEKGLALIDAAGRGLAKLLEEVHRLPAHTLQEKIAF